VKDEQGKRKAKGKDEQGNRKAQVNDEQGNREAQGKDEQGNREAQGKDEQGNREVQGKDEQKHVNETRRQTKTCTRQSHGCCPLLLDFVHFGDQIVFGDLEVCGG
jgi:hypothetical protein